MNYTYQKSLGLISRTIAKKIGKQLETNLQRNSINLTAVQWSIISMLQHKKESSQKNITMEFGYDKVMVMRIIRSLEERKIVHKRTCSKDKRTRIVTLTAQGQTIYKKVEPIAEKTIKDALYTLTDREVDFYFQISERIIANLNKQSDV